MTNNVHHIAFLVSKQLQEPLSTVEELELNRWLQESPGNKLLFDQINDEQQAAAALKRYYDYNDKRLSDKISASIPDFKRSVPTTRVDTSAAPVAHRVHFLRRSWFRYAAAVALVFSTVAYLWKTDSTQTGTASAEARSAKVDIAPGRDRAILTLANGQQILLDSTQGNVVDDGNLTVVNLAGKLKYEGIGKGEEYNTLHTPKGGQYQIVLPDGSKVWLNAASSIRFPTAFTGKIRKVEMSGEAYMEIAPNPKQAFVISANGVEIRVLGTSFNVNAYADETSIKTTLFEGSVKVSKADRVAILKPGQQASAAENISVRSNADLGQTLAWKNGLFNFSGSDLKSVMRQLERWYDIKVQYEGQISNDIFKGEMYRNVNLSDVLDMLREMGVQFRMQGKTLIVTS